MWDDAKEARGEPEGPWVIYNNGYRSSYTSGCLCAPPNLSYSCYTPPWRRTRFPLVPYIVDK
ncbi:hypothetical protein RRG08_049085 [Elysia crispata]|uniref:Uncharacterized protein n=1 Tax=Elysia crispata TaxID=231223 RepID=A0AAE1A9T3_9GAST|nr:hypothetical protein RRG08_049085 [Elysia crispata]